VLSRPKNKSGRMQPTYKTLFGVGRKKERGNLGGAEKYARGEGGDCRCQVRKGCSQKERKKNNTGVVWEPQNVHTLPGKNVGKVPSEKRLGYRAGANKKAKMKRLAGEERSDAGKSKRTVRSKKRRSWGRRWSEIPIRQKGEYTVRHSSEKPATAGGVQKRDRPEKRKENGRVG